MELRDGLRWDDIHTKFHEDLFWHSSNIKATTSTIRAVVMLVLLMGGIYIVGRLDGLRWHDIHTKFHKDRLRHSKVDMEGGDTHRDTHIHRQQGDIISLL
jgi:hypothetical protein